MASTITGVAPGKKTETYDNVETVKDVRIKMGLGEDYAATVNGEVADDDTELEDFQHVAFAQKVKGGK